MSSSPSSRAPARSPAALAPRETTYQYGIRPVTTDGPAGEGSSLLVTRGHVDIEVFTERRGGAATQGGMGPIGIYSDPPHTRPAQGQAAGRRAMSP